jgi:hypothetical protein
MDEPQHKELRIGNLLLATQCETCKGEGWMALAPGQESLCRNCYGASGWILSEVGDILHYFIQVIGFKKR